MGTTHKDKKKEESGIPPLKILLCLVLAVLLVAGGAIAYLHSVISQKTINDFQNSIWVCADPYMRVIKGNTQISMYIGKGQERQKVDFCLTGRNFLNCNVIADDSTTVTLFKASLRFTDTEMYLHFVYDDLFNHQYDSLVFQRYNNDYAVPSIEFEP